MAKRFIETQIFEKELLSTLEAPYKLLFFYYITKCDHAGIMDHHALKLASFILDHPYTVEGVDEAFNGKLITIGKKWFMPSFVEFQYGSLNEANRAHNSVIKLLVKHSICPISLQFKPLTSPLQGAKDMVKDQSKVKVKEMFSPPTIEEFIEYLLVELPKINPQWMPEQIARACNVQFDTYVEQDWRTGGDKPRKIKNWKTTAKNSMKHLKPWNFGSTPGHHTSTPVKYVKSL